jgi:chemotaxis protein methyltransferase CheR
MMVIRSGDSLNDIELDLIVEAIWRRYQYDFRDYSRASLLRRLERAQAHFGVAHLSGLLDVILHDSASLPVLIGFLTIQVSDMFRDPEYFRMIRETVIPHLATWPTIKVWIAGCANGEEFYSLAILFREAGLEDRTMFYCTDISRPALAKAEAGIFDIERIAGFSRNYREAGGKGSLSYYYTANSNVARFDPALKIPDRLFAAGYANGVIFRAFPDNIIGLAPALCASDSEMDEIFARIGKTLDGLLDERDIRAALAA